MDNVDLDVLRTVLAWRRAGHGVHLYTVVQTWGSAPRQPGSMLALREDGAVIGSVSGGCIEDDLIHRQASEVKAGNQSPVRLIAYGLSREEAARFGLPCGGTLRLTEEKIDKWDWVEELVSRCEHQQLSKRVVNITSGHVRLTEALPHDRFQFDEHQMEAVHGPSWRLMMIGAGQVSRYAAEMALLLGFKVMVCDPRPEFAVEFDDPRVTLVPGMPDDAVEAIKPDERTVIVTLTHDPRLDDMALMTALKSRAFYVGALGSKQTTTRRREYLLELGITPQEISRLHGPIGLYIGSHTPAEIALSLMTQIVALKNGVAH
ncbi:XdhC family protein [Pseudomonas sp. NPDC090208]|uniref:XdhC family protein n=1 Tax=Pseudomonas sp. NPDC090208 TaxID=3364478 RepID=UPI00380B3CC3